MSTPKTRKANSTLPWANHWLDRCVQSAREKSMTPRFGRAVTAFVFIAVALSAELFLHFRAMEEASANRTAALSFASELRARSDRELNSVLYLSSGVVGYLVVRHDKIDPQEINSILRAVHGYGRHIRNFSLAVGYRVAYVYPLPGNEAILGRDYRDLSAQWPAIRATIAAGNSALTGPVDLVQGGRALIYRIPVFVDNGYWGLLSTVIDMSSFQKAAFGGLDTAHFEFAIRSVEPAGAGGGLLWGRQELFADPQAIQLEAEVPNGRWVYAVRSTRQGGSAMVWMLRGAGWLLAVLAGLGVFTVLRQRSELARHAGFDSLTNLPNRRLFDDRLEQMVSRHARVSQSLIAAVFLDLNGFKRINDVHGHRFGDAVLRIVAARIREEVRLSDTVARWAGDEFVLLIEGAEREFVAQLEQRLRRRIAVPFEVDSVALTVSAAIGIAYYPDEADSPAKLLELADRRMFEDKSQRKEKAKSDGVFR